MITLQFSTTSGPISRFIRFFTWSDFSHVDVVLPDDTLLGAQWDGVKVRPFDYANFTKRAWFAVDLPKDVEQKVYEFLFAQVGKPYDKTAILGFPLRWNWQRDDKWFCSELVAAAFAQAGRPLVREIKNRVTPRDLTLSPLLFPLNALARMVKAALHASVA